MNGLRDERSKKKVNSFILGEKEEIADKVGVAATTNNDERWIILFFFS